MIEQLSFVSELEPVQSPVKPLDFQGFSEREIAEYIGKSIGIIFEYNDNEWVWRNKKTKIGVRLSHYSCDGVSHKMGQPFVGVDWNYGCTSGGAVPCNDMGEALRWVWKIMKNEA